MADDAPCRVSPDNPRPFLRALFVERRLPARMMKRLGRRG